MKKAVFTDYAAAKGWKLFRNTALSVWDGYPFCMTFLQGNIQIRFRLEKGPADRELSKEIRGQIKGWKELGTFNGQFDPAAAFLSVTVSRLPEESAYALDRIFQAAVGLLKEHGLVPPRTCPVCGNGECDCVALLHNEYVPTHRDCVGRVVHETELQAEESLSKGSYLRGFVGAVIGGLVGALPSLLTILFLERMFVVLYALIPLAAYYGYKLLQGTMDKGAMVCTVISGILNLFSLNFLVFVFQVRKLYGALPLGFLFTAFFGNLGTILPDMILDFVFLALGIWICYGRISRTAKGDVSNAYAVLDTVESYTHPEAHSNHW